MPFGKMLLGLSVVALGTTFAAAQKKAAGPATQPNGVFTATRK